MPSWHGCPGPHSPVWDEALGRVSVGPGGPAPLICQRETPPMGIYPGLSCYRHHPGQQMACRDGEGEPMLQSPMSK